MKKIICAILSLLLALSLSACRNKGNAENVNITLGASDTYTETEIQSAIDRAISYFETHFDGCTMTDIWYDAEAVQKDEADFAKQYEADQCIVLLSNFDVDETGGDGGFQPNSTYKNWNWVLVRNGQGKWVIRTYGY